MYHHDRPPKKHQTLSYLSAMTVIGSRKCTTNAVCGSRGVQPGSLLRRTSLQISIKETISPSQCTSILWTGTLTRMSCGRLPKRFVFGNLEGAVRRGRGGKEKVWTDCVQSDIRAFGIAGDRKATALKAEVWVETVAEGGRRFMAAWKKEEADAARHRQENREVTSLEKLLSHTEG